MPRGAMSPLSTRLVVQQLGGAPPAYGACSADAWFASMAVEQQQQSPSDDSDDEGDSGKRRRERGTADEGMGEGAA
eukprot:5131118-Prymnesium_polylepis.1